MKIARKLKQGLVPHRHNNYHPHAIRWRGLFVFALVILAVQIANSSQLAGEFKVLGYATNVSTSDLYSLTNSQRTSRGLSAYRLNSKLSSAAQAKANHMIANNYWSHTAPDGTTPWYFIGNAGYSYERAGENLAYGFSTSSGVITGWMNSPSHAANILDNSFQEVGFGFANGANFQGGENTVVVAMYGQPIASVPAPAPAPAPAAPISNYTPAPTPAPVPAPVAQAEKEIKEEIEEEVEEEIEEERELGSQYFLSRLDPEVIKVNGPVYDEQVEGDTITNLEAVLGGQAHWSLYLTMGALFALAIVYFFRHMTAIFQYVKHGEHYVAGHPLLEASLIYAVLWILMAGTYGVVL